MSRINRDTVQRATSKPSRFSWRQTLRTQRLRRAANLGRD
jgi:hypothetical protein